MTIIHMKGACIMLLKDELWDEISRPMYIFLKKLPDNIWMNKNC